MHFSCSPPPLDASLSGNYHGGHNNNSYHRNRQKLYQRIPLRACHFDTSSNDYQEKGKEEEDYIMIIQELDSDNSMSDSFMGPTQRIYRHVPSLTSSDCFGSTAPHPPQNDMTNMNNNNTRIEQDLSFQEQQRHASFIPQTCDDAPQQQQHFSIRTSIKRDSWAVDPSPWVVPVASSASTKRMRLSSGYSYSSG